VAFWIWTAISAICLLGAIGSITETRAMGDVFVILILPLVLLYPATIDCFWYSEAELIELFLLVAVLWCLRRDEEGAAGVLLGLAALFKAYPIVMGGYLVATRRWRALASALVTGFVGLAIAGSTLGMRSLTGFVIAAGRETYAWHFLNLSMSGFLTRTYWRFFTALNSQTPRTILIVACQIGILFASYRLTRKHRDEIAENYGLWIVTMLLVCPIVWLAYLVLLIIPMVILLHSAALDSANRISVYAAMVSLALIFTIGPFAERIMRASRLLRLLDEGQFMALAVSYLSAYSLAADNDFNIQNRETRKAPVL
jgi:hypothetical protein